MTRASPSSGPTFTPYEPATATPADSGKDAVDLLLEQKKVERHHVGPHLIENQQRRVKELSGQQRRMLREEIVKQRAASMDAEVHTHLTYLHDAVESSRKLAEKATDFVDETLLRAKDLFAEKIDTLKSDKTDTKEKVMAGLTLGAPLLAVGAAALLALAFGKKHGHSVPVIGPDGQPVKDKDGNVKMQEVTDRKISTLGKIFLATGFAAVLFGIVRYFGGGAKERRAKKAAEEQATAEAEKMKLEDGSIPLEGISPGAVIDGKKVSFIGSDTKRHVISFAPGEKATTVEIGENAYAMTLLEADGEKVPKITRIYPSNRGGLKFFYDAGMFNTTVSVHVDKDQIEMIERELAKGGDGEKRIEVQTIIPKAEITGVVSRVEANIMNEKPTPHFDGANYIARSTFVFRKTGSASPSSKPADSSPAAPKDAKKEEPKPGKDKTWGEKALDLIAKYGPKKPTTEPPKPKP